MATQFDWPPKPQTYRDRLYADFLGPTLLDYQKRLSEPMPTLNFKNNLMGFDKTMNTQITMPATNGLGANLLQDKPATGSDKLNFKSGLKKLGPDLLAATPDLLEGGLKMAGAKEADLSSMAENIWEKGSKTAFQASVKTGNPIAMAATGASYALSLLNKYGGKKADTQNTLGIDTGPYATEISANAGKKATMIGTYGASLLGGAIGVLGRNTKPGKFLFGNSKLDNINAATARADNKNLLSSTVSYTNKRNLLGAQNSAQDITNKNSQQLMGGINPKVLSAQSGTKLVKQQLQTAAAKPFTPDPKLSYPSPFLNSYLHSPKHKERLENVIADDIDMDINTLRSRGKDLLDADVDWERDRALTKLKKVRIKIGTNEEGGSNYYNSDKKLILLDGQYGGYHMTAPHELAHAFEPARFYKQYLDIFNRSELLSDKEYEAFKFYHDILEEHEKTASKPPSDLYKALALATVINEDYDHGLHDLSPDEARADIYSLRYNLYRNGIYDARTQDFTREHYKKAFEKYGKDVILKRLFDRFSEDDFIHLMNSVVQNKPEQSTTLYAKHGAKINPATLRNISNKVGLKKTNVSNEPEKVNVIPEGALHARKHNLPEEIAEYVTEKGIPVITQDEDGEITQHAEIENSEIIFHKETTNKLEDWFKEYKTADAAKKKELELECGKFLVEEILENTIDNVGLLE